MGVPGSPSLIFAQLLKDKEFIYFTFSKGSRISKVWPHDFYY